MTDLVPLHDTYLSENHLMNYYEYYTIWNHIAK